MVLLRINNKKKVEKNTVFVGFGGGNVTEGQCSYFLPSLSGLMMALNQNTKYTKLTALKFQSNLEKFFKMT